MASVKMRDKKPLQRLKSIGIEPSEPDSALLSQPLTGGETTELHYHYARRCSLVGPADASSLHSAVAADPAWPLLKAKHSVPKFDAKKLVWLADEKEGFVRVEVKSRQGDSLVLSVPGKGDVKKTTAETAPANPHSLEAAEDMSDLSFLSDAAVLHNLRTRYAQLLIYTYSGLFCVVVNPYKRVGIYTESVVRMYMGKRRGELPPHLFAVADEAYRRLIDDGRDQAVLVTGESGAGKTENTKKLISYLALVGAAEGRRKSSPSAGTLEEQIVQTNPVLEAFGNAKTLKNDNSSRFGKFIRVHFSQAGKLAGGDIEHYLLEKSRVTKQAPGERSYHIFYQIMSGAMPGLKESLGLTKALSAYRLVGKSEARIAGLDDQEQMEATDEAMDILGFEDWEKTATFETVAAVLHLGEMDFRQRPRSEQAEVGDAKEAGEAARLLGVDVAALQDAFLKPRVRVGGDWVSKGQNLQQVGWSVEATAKGVYSRLFAWLIRRCNASLDARDIRRQSFIGVLDIAGFEIFATNSFEQLWINFVNEKLQQFFNHHMFVREQEEYTQEGIKWEFIDFGLDLQACINLIEKPLGVLSVLDEECIVPKASDESFSRKLGEVHLGKSPHFLRPRPPKGPDEPAAHFALKHYAGTVRYTATGWLEKNKDPLNDTVAALLKAAPNSRLQPLLWDDYITAEEMASGSEKRGGGKKGSFRTASVLYRDSLARLLGMLGQTEPHFIRCILPNARKAAGALDGPLVLAQLACNGVLEGIRIARKGFPSRLTHADFRQRYAILSGTGARANSALAACELMTRELVASSTLSPESSRVGASKVFLKAGVVSHLEQARDAALDAVVAQFQAVCRAFSAANDLRQRRRQAAHLALIQRNVRAWARLRNWHWFRLFGQIKPLIKGDQAMQELQDSLAAEQKLRQSAEDAAASAAGRLESSQRELGSANRRFKELEASLAAAEHRLGTREAELRSLEDEVKRQDALITRLGKDAKRVEELNHKLTEELQGEEDKANQVHKVTARLEATVDEMEETVEREKRARVDADKAKRKLEGEIRVAAEAAAEATAQRADLETALRRKEEELAKVAEIQEAESNSQSRASRALADMAAKLAAAEEELEAEKTLRAKLERGRREAEAALEELEERTEEALASTTAQADLNRRRETEMTRLRKELEETTAGQESLLGLAKKRSAETMAELGEQLDAAQKAKVRLEREKAELGRQLEDAQSALDTQVKGRMNSEKTAKSLEAQLADAEMKRDALSHQLTDMTLAKNKAESEVTAVRRELSEAESGLGAAARLKAQLSGQVEEAREAAAEETRRVAHANGQLRSLERELETLRETLEDEEEAKAALQRQLSKVNQEAASWRSKWEEDGQARLEELEEGKRKLAIRVQELTETAEAAGGKLAAVEKTRARLIMELEDAQAEADRNQGLALALEKKQKHLERAAEESSRAAALSASELETAQTVARTASTEAQRARLELDEALEALEASRRESRALAAELRELREEVEEGSAAAAELGKVRRRAEADRQELQTSLEEAESATEAAEAKLARALVELQQKDAETRKLLEEKDEDFVATRRNHARAMESLQATLEAEAQGRAEGSKTRTRLEAELGRVELALDQTTAAHQEALRQLKAAGDAQRDLLAQLEEEARERDAATEATAAVERRMAALQGERLEMQGRIEAEEKHRRLLDAELGEAREELGETQTALATANADRKRLQLHLETGAGDVEELGREVEEAAERERRAREELARQSEALRTAQDETAALAQRLRECELRLKAAAVRAEEAEAESLRTERRVTAKLEARLNDMEAEMTEERRQQAELVKTLRVRERRLKELEFQAAEDAKNAERLHDVAERLQAKLKTTKRQLCEAEEQAGGSMAKVRGLQAALESSEDRAESAEAGLTKLRVRSRGGVGGRLPHSASAMAGGGLAHSASFAYGFGRPGSGLAHSSSMGGTMRCDSFSLGRGLAASPLPDEDDL